MNWRNKIEGLLAKAQANGVTDQERETLIEKAAYLAAKFGIDDAVARTRSKFKLEPNTMIFKTFAPYANRKIDLLYIVVKSLGCRMVISGKTTLTVFGFPEDLERVKILYHSLLAQMHIEGASLRIPVGVHGKTFRSSWLVGFIFGVQGRLDRANMKAHQESPGTDLILKNQSAIIDTAVNDMFPNLTKNTKKTKVTLGNAFDLGRAAGARADLGGKRLSSSGRSSISG